MIDNVLEKRQDENEFEHHKRLVYGKLKDKSLADYDYGELSKHVYGKQYSPDDARKRMYGSAATLEILDALGISNLTEDDFVAELKNQRLELQKDKKQFQDQRREFNKIVADEARWDHLYGILAEAARNLPRTIGDESLFYIQTHKPYDTSDDEAVIFLSDWHYGLVTDNVWNKYNVEICKERVKCLLNDVLDRIAIHKCHRAHIVLLGDMANGGIHASCRVASEELVADQLMHVSEILAQFINVVSQTVECVDVYSTFGNHMRTIQRKEDNIHMDNMERIIPWWLEERFKALSVDNVTIHNDNDYEFILFDVCGHHFCATHGDLDGVGRASSSLGMLFSRAYGVDIETIVLADKHRQESFEEFGVEALLTGSLCGTDEYANSKRLYSDPFQLMLIVNPQYGVDARYKLKCLYS